MPKISSFSSSDFYGHVGKRLDNKTEVNFKVYDTISWETNNHKIYIAYYLKKWMQLDSENKSIVKM